MGGRCCVVSSHAATAATRAAWMRAPTAGPRSSPQAHRAAAAMGGGGHAPARRPARPARRVHVAGRAVIFAMPRRPRASHSQASSASPKRAGLRSASQRSSRRTRAAADKLAAAVDVAVLARHHSASSVQSTGHAQALAHGLQQFHAALLVADVARQHVGGRGALAQVVHQAGPAHGQWGVQARGHVAAPSSRARRCRPRGGSRRAAARPTGGPARAAARPARRRRAARRTCARACGLHQPARQFLPHPLGHQVVGLAVLRPCPASAPSFRGPR
jgi:hypothetical protein